MPLEPRLRDALRREVDDIHPNVESHLEAVTRRNERRSGGPAGLLAAAAVIAVVLLVVIQPGVQRTGVAPSGVTGAASPTASVRPDGSDAPLQLTGAAWTVELSGSDPGVDALGMAGTWTMRLGDDATIDLRPPSAFEPPSGRKPIGYVHAEDGASFVTTLFARDFAAPCAGPGTYTWMITGDRLTFTTDDDTCDARRTLLTTRQWSLATTSDPG
jgi:hypothetical protein